MLLTKIHALEDRLAPDSSDNLWLIMARDCKQTRAYCIPAERIMVRTVAIPSLRVRVPVMQYIRCCGSEGLDFETRHQLGLHYY